MTDSWVGTSAATSVSRAALLLALRVILLFAAAAVTYLLLTAFSGPAAYATGATAVGGVSSGAATGDTRTTTDVVSTPDATSPVPGGSPGGTARPAQDPVAVPGGDSGTATLAGTTTPRPVAPGAQSPPRADTTSTAGSNIPDKAAGNRAGSVRSTGPATGRVGAGPTQAPTQGPPADGRPVEAGTDHGQAGPRQPDRSTAGHGSDRPELGRPDGNTVTPTGPETPESVDDGRAPESDAGDGDTGRDVDTTERNGHATRSNGRQDGDHTAPGDGGAEHPGAQAGSGPAVPGPAVSEALRTGVRDAHQSRPGRGVPAGSAATTTGSGPAEDIAADGSEPPVPGVPAPAQSAMVVEGLSSGQANVSVSLVASLLTRPHIVPDRYRLHADRPGDLTRPGRVPGVTPVPG